MDKKQILAELGDLPEKVYDELVEEAFQQSARQMFEMSQFIDSGQPDRAAAVAHSMKGCFANLRLAEVSSAAGKLEAALKREGHSGEVFTLYSALGVALKTGGGENV